jgi:hypothetical protein
LRLIRIDFASCALTELERTLEIKLYYLPVAAEQLSDRLAKQPGERAESTAGVAGWANPVATGINGLAPCQAICAKGAVPLALLNSCVCVRARST